MFLPATKNEMAKLGWNALDVILVTGDAYIDSPLIGVSVIGKVLCDAGYRVGIIAQPDIGSDRDIGRLGEPELFWGITSGCVDSMVANYTALKKVRNDDDFTPGGKNTKRPDRAVLAYANLVRRFFKSTKPVVLGGIEASLRRIAHYDYWSDTVRRSILFDAKADYLIYGMGEKTTLDLAGALKDGRDPKATRGICHISKEPANDCITLPSFEEAKEDKEKFTEMFHLFYRNCDPVSAHGLAQKHADRFLIHNPPNYYFTGSELDRIHELDFERDAHPLDAEKGTIRALETIRFSIASHRGCFGECNFCSIAVHQGRMVQSRSEDSILREAKTLARHREFKGYIVNVGGPTANMYGSCCDKMTGSGACADKRCLYPGPCLKMKLNHEKQVSLLRKMRVLKGVKGVFIGSGVRYDMILADKNHGIEYLEELVKHHISGQMKVAPEHSEAGVLRRMGKPGKNVLVEFRNEFYRLTKKHGKKQFLTYYLIAAHPGCTGDDMRNLRDFALMELDLLPEQVQIFMPTPSTYSTLMYYTGKDPFTGENLFVERDKLKKDSQKEEMLKPAAPRKRISRRDYGR